MVLGYSICNVRVLGLRAQAKVGHHLSLVSSPLVNGIILKIDDPYVPWLEKGPKDNRAGVGGRRAFLCLFMGHGATC